jgi:uncharacterized protein (DUF362 family)
VAKITRRDFVKGVAAAGAFVYAGGFLSPRQFFSQADKSRVFRVDHCPVDDWQPATNAPLRHQGLDTLLNLLADRGIYLYSTAGSPTWGGPDGLIAPDDVVLIKVNCQWKCRGTTNTDLLRGLIHRILEHPDGFTGEVVIMENGQGRGGFDGMAGGGSYDAWPEIAGNVYVNAEQETVLTVGYLVNTVFQGAPVSSFLLDNIGSRFIGTGDHTTNGYRKTSDVSYPCFTSAGGNRIELFEGIWENGAYNQSKLKLINVPVLKDHGGTGTTGVLKHVYGIVSMADGSSGIRHYSQSGSQCGKVWSLVRTPDLNILDCIWVSFDSLTGYPPETTSRTDTLLAGLDPVALDYYAAKHIMLPLGGSRALEHDPDSLRELKRHLDGAQNFINENGGIAGQSTRQGDDNIEVIAASAGGTDTGGNTGTGASTQGGGGGGGCFIATAAYGCRMAEEVIALQGLRDICFSNNSFGRALVSAYYRHSPKLAELIAKSPLLRGAVRAALYPLVWVAKAALASRRAA